MARSKQPAVRRESSSEFFNRDTARWEDVNGKAVVANGRRPATAAAEVPEKEAGVVQLVIAVAGIYASLYAPGISLSIPRRKIRPFIHANEP